jgi:uncharacterized protein (TIGR02145 family)
MNKKLVWVAVALGIFLGFWVLEKAKPPRNKLKGTDLIVEYLREQDSLNKEQLRIDDSLKLDLLEKSKFSNNDQLEQLFLFLRQNRTPFLDKRDGEVYDTVKIGAYTWMAENLRFDALNSYLNPENPHQLYGRLYDWATVMDLDKKYNEASVVNKMDRHRGICPDGWRVPNIKEWRNLEMAFGAESYKGTERYLKDETNPYWNGTHGQKMKTPFFWDPIDVAAINNRFNILPAGQQYKKGEESIGIGYMSCFWTTEEYNHFSAWARSFNATEQGVNRTYVNKGMGCSCRCVKD